LHALDLDEKVVEDQEKDPTPEKKGLITPIQVSAKMKEGEKHKEGVAKNEERESHPGGKIWQLAQRQAKRE